MRILVWLPLALFLASPAFAQTQVIFSRDGQTATVLLVGMPGDPDPVKFYNSLKVAPEDFQGKWSKKLSLAGPDGAKSFDAACIFSKVMPNNGTCTLIFHATDGRIEVNSGAGKANLWLTGNEARLFSDFFVLPEESGFVFRSTDGRLNISFLPAPGGSISDFVMDWKGRGI